MSFNAIETNRLIEEFKKSIGQISVSVVREALQNKANPNPPELQMPFLSFAAQAGSTPLCEVLVQHGADLEALGADPRRFTPLILAVLGNHQDTCQLLLEAGAKCDSLDHYKKSALSWAAKRGYLPICKALVQFGASLNPHTSVLVEAVSSNALYAARFLIEQGADVDSKDHERWSCLNWAASHNNLLICNLLLDHGADPNGDSSSDFPPLLSALEVSSPEIFRLLLQYGANPDNILSNGMSIEEYIQKNKAHAMLDVIREYRIEQERLKLNETLPTASAKKNGIRL